MTKHSHNLPMQHRAGQLVPLTRAADTGAPANRFKVVWTTGAPVRRYDWRRGKAYEEELATTGNSVRLGRLNAGASVLNSHSSWDLNDVIGAVVPGTARMTGGEGEAEVVVDDGPETAAVLRKIESGIIRHISVGYVVHTYEKTEREDGPDQWRAVDWEPYEISFVPIPADPGAGLRSDQQSTYPCQFINRAAPEEATNKETTMPKDTGTTKTAEAKAAELAAAQARAADPEPTEAPTGAPTDEPADEAIRRQAVLAERTRTAEIQSLVRAAKLDPAFAERLVTEGVTLDSARKQILDELAAADADPAAQHRNHVTQVRAEADKIRTAATSALLHRYDPAFKLEGGGEDFRGMSLLEMGRDLLERRGVRTRGLSRNELAGAMLGLTHRDGGLHGTSDFPNILLNVATKTLRRAYEAAPQTFRPFSRQGTVSDFKTAYRMQLGDAPSLTTVNESGEFKRGTVGEAKESFAAVTYGRIVGVSRQVLVNDDLQAFTRLPEMFGRAAADLESDTVWAVLTANPTMGDGNALFDATNHGNFTSSGTAISVANLGIGRKAMRVQTGLNGRYINVMPKYLIVPPSQETLAQQFTTATNVIYTKGSDTNPFAQTLQVIAEPRLEANSTTAWYLAADPSQIDTIEFGNLEGQQGVFLESRIGFDVDGMELKVREDFYAKALDWRGFYKNAGA